MHAQPPELANPLGQQLLQQQQQEDEQQQQQLSTVAKVLITFSLLLIVLPIALYFVTKSLLFEGALSMSPRQSYIYAAIVAVVTVHVILAGFVFFAFYESGRGPPETVKRD